MTSEHFYNTKAMGVIPDDERYATVLNIYDDEGRLVSEEYLDASDNPVCNKQGFAAHYISYTESGLIQDEYYLNENETPAAVEGEDNQLARAANSQIKSVDGPIAPFLYSRRTLISENPAEETYVMTVLDETATEESPYAMMIQTYDRYGRAIDTAYYDCNGSPAIGPEGCQRVIREYTSRDQIALIRYLDEKGNGMMVNGVYGVKREYNAYANLEIETWLDGEGNPSINDEGFAQIHYDYDLSDSSSAEKYFYYYEDQNGEPVSARNGAYGMTIIYYPIAKTHVVTYLDQDDNPVITSDGYAILEYEEDEFGNRTYEAYYDEIHAQTNCVDGYANVERRYDSEGRLIYERYQDRYNKLTNNAEGVAGWNGYYDDDGNLVITNRYDKDLKPVE